MDPIWFLLTVVGITAVAWAIDAIARDRRSNALRFLAREWRMQYTAVDRVRLAGRIASRLPLPGASDVCVLNLLYRTHAGRHWYLFTAEFGRGVVTAKTRRRLVVAFDEPTIIGNSSEAGPMRIADESRPLIEQYRQLHEESAQGAGASTIS